MSYGERIKSARIKRNLTQMELGLKLGVTGVTIMRYEKDQRTPSVEILLRIAEVLNVAPEYLFGIVDEDGFLTSDLFADPDDFELLKMLGYDDPAIRNATLPDVQTKLPDSFYSLNPEGQQKAIERVQELTEIPKYQAKKQQ